MNVVHVLDVLVLVLVVVVLVVLVVDVVHVRRAQARLQAANVALREERDALTRQLIQTTWWQSDRRLRP